MIISAAEIVRALGGGHGRTCRCPAHDDHHFSLSVNDGRDGKVLVKCHAGCSQEAVIKALEDRGLWRTDQPFSLARKKRDPSPEQEEAERFRKACEILYAAGHAKNAGSPSAYLNGRGIEIVPPCAMLLPAKDSGHLTGIKYPAMVVPVINSGKICAAQVTWLETD